MKKNILVLFVMMIAFNVQAQTNYYIDAVYGNDANSGTISSAPWKNLSKLYNLTLSAGSAVYLMSGSVWTGQQLKFKGSGTASLPIKVLKYGTGADPVIHGNGIVGQGVVYLYNQQYIEINNLEITNCPGGPNNSSFFLGLYNNSVSPNPNPLGADRRGVMIAIDNYGTASHIWLNNLNIHHIKGQLGNGNSLVNGAIPKRTGGIYFAVLDTLETSSKKSRFHDIKIDSCEISYCENIGLAFDNEYAVYYPGGQNSTIPADQTEYANWFSRRYSNILISNNIIHHIGKNAMIIRCTDSTGLIDHNVCYETALGTTGNTMFTARAKGTVFQYNEGYYNRATTQNVDPGNIDGSMYDPDFGSVGIIFQYSYSHDNSEGIYWGCNTRGGSNNTSGIPDPGDVGCTLRYCISQNDKGDLIFFNYPSAGNEIYNNVFYISSGSSPNIIHENSGNNHTYNYFNNIIYNLSSATTGADYAFGSGSGIQNRNISHNTFFGNHHSTEPSDPYKLILDPAFLNPGSGTTGIQTLDGYKLYYGSSALNSGRLIQNNGGLDYFGNQVSASSSPNRGCYQGAGVNMPASPDLYSSVDAPLNSTFFNGDVQEGYVTISNASAEPTSGTVTFSIYKPVNFTLDVMNNATTAAGAVVNNADWDIVSSPFTYILSSKPGVVIGGNGSSRIGFRFTATGNAGSSYIMTISINNGSGGSTSTNGDNFNANNQSVNLFVIN